MLRLIVPDGTAAAGAAAGLMGLALGAGTGVAVFAPVKEEGDANGGCNAPPLPSGGRNGWNFGIGRSPSGGAGAGSPTAAVEATGSLGTAEDAGCGGDITKEGTEGDATFDAADGLGAAAFPIAEPLGGAVVEGAAVAAGRTAGSGTTGGAVSAGT